MKRIFAIFIAVFILGAALAPLQAQEVKALRTETIRLNFLNAQQVQQLLYPYLSKQGTIVIDPLYGKFLTLRDYPDLVDKVLAVIKEIDVKPADITFTVQLVIGSATGEAKGDESILNDPVIKELKNLLTYKSFSLLDANIIRTIDSERAELSLGKNSEFSLMLRPRYTKDGADEVIRLEIRLNMIIQPEPVPAVQAPEARSRTLIETNLFMKSGEKTVVGVSKLDGGDKGLILILSGKVIK